MCGNVVNFELPVGTDNCASYIITQTSGLASGAFYPIGLTQEIFMIEDVSGNIAVCQFSITIVDETYPEITCPENLTVANDAGVCGAIVNYDLPLGSDNCGGAIITLNQGLGSGALYPIGQTTESYIIEDGSGNVHQCSFQITVEDEEVPVIICPENQTVANDAGLCGAIVNYDLPLGSDNCSGALITLDQGLGSGALYPIGQTTESYFIEDVSGNVGQCSFQITVEVIEAPEITCPGNLTVVNDSGICGAIVNYNLPLGTDNCSGALITLDQGLGSGALYPIGQTMESYSIDYGSGNVDQCSFQITVEDVEVPIITCPDNLTVVNDAGICGAIVIYDFPLGSDNCDGALITLDQGLGNGALYPIGQMTESYSIEDGSGNIHQCSFQITVEDVEAPVITCPNDISIDIDLFEDSALVDYNLPVVSDNCGNPIAHLVSGQESGSNFPVGVNFVIYASVDAVGNSDTCQFTITVNDGSLRVIQIESRVFPNPTRDKATIDFILPLTGETIIRLISGSGEIMNSQDLGMLEGHMPHQFEFRAQNWSAGIYIYQIVSGNFTTTGRIVLLR